MEHSTLSEQIRKKGLIISPWMDRLGDRLTLNSWSIERLPEYIWLALILDECNDRISGIKKCTALLRNIIALCPEVTSAKMSTILDLDEETQRKIYEIIGQNINSCVLSSLTLIIDEEISQPFFKAFFSPDLTIDRRKERLHAVTKKYYASDSYDTTDLRYMAIVPTLITGRLNCFENEQLLDAIKNYGVTDHSNEIMRAYRPSIRTTESLISEALSESKFDFVGLYWRTMSNLSDCVLHAIRFKPSKRKTFYRSFIEKTKEALDYLNIENKERTANDDAYSVLTGSFAYALKLFDEVITHNLGNTIIGRQSIRIIIEIFLTMKYLSQTETNNPLVWTQFKAYGIGKYKLVLLKMREGMGNSITHVNEKMLDLLVNEQQLEEFTDIDLKYFDNVKIRDKAIKVDEKCLFDTAYDYDSSYAHGLWGAVRESSMLLCDNVFHHYRPVADSSLKQNLPDVSLDCFNTFLKLFGLVKDRYPFPEWYTNYIKELEN